MRGRIKTHTENLHQHLSHLHWELTIQHTVSPWGVFYFCLLGSEWGDHRECTGKGWWTDTLPQDPHAPVAIFISSCIGWKDKCLPRFACEAGEPIYLACLAKRILIRIISKESRKKLARVSRPWSRQPFIVPNSSFNFCDRVIQSLRP